MLRGSAQDRAKATRRPGSIMAGLATIFNIIALTFCLVALSLPVVTIPLALAATSSALYGWRHRGEDRVLRGFWAAIRTAPLRKTGIVLPALAGTVLGGAEVAYFIHYRGPIAVICLTIGALTAAAGMSLLAYLLLVLSVAAATGWGEAWHISLAILARTSLTATPVFVAETLAAALTGFTDPALIVIFLPVALLWAWQRTAIWGARRAGLQL